MFIPFLLILSLWAVPSHAAFVHRQRAIRRLSSAAFHLHAQEQHSDDHHPKFRRQNGAEPRLGVSSRRSLLEKWTKSGFAAAGLASALATASKQAEAACLPGDLSPDCIGVYKMPANDVKPMIGMPRTSDEALQVLEAQRAAADDIMNVILQGRLEEGGIKVLNLIPRVSMAGRIVIRDGLSSASSSSLSSSSVAVAAMSNQEVDRILRREASIQQLKETQLESALSNVLNSFGECDVMIGQGIRGEMGVVTFAQIYILFELQDAIRAYDDFLCIARKHCVSTST